MIGMRCVTLLAGEPPAERGGDYDCLAVHVGQSVDPVPQDFGDFDPEGFKENILGQFMKFAQSTSGRSIKVC